MVQEDTVQGGSQPVPASVLHLHIRDRPSDAPRDQDGHVHHVVHVELPEDNGRHRYEVMAVHPRKRRSLPPPERECLLYHELHVPGEHERRQHHQEGDNDISEHPVLRKSGQWEHCGGHGLGHGGRVPLQSYEEDVPLDGAEISPRW